MFNEKNVFKRRITELEEAIHKIHLHKLTKIETYIKRLEDLAKELEGVRGELKEKGISPQEVKRLSAVAKSILDEKNTIREIRYTIKLTELEEQRLRDMIAEDNAKRATR